MSLDSQERNEFEERANAEVKFFKDQCAAWSAKYQSLEAENAKLTNENELIKKSHSELLRVLTGLNYQHNDPFLYQDVRRVIDKAEAVKAALKGDRCQHDVDGKDCFECYPTKGWEG